jgi:hypothetical protein
VARTVRRMLLPHGVWAHVHATTHRGVGGRASGPFPEPPHDRIEELVARYLGSTRRAGRGLLPHGTATGEEAVMVAAGFTAPRRLQVPGRPLERSADEVVAAVFSRSSSAPHLFGERLPQFEDELRGLLAAVSPQGRFLEHSREIDLVLWRA